jgi:4-aminobutyrate aminotransferase-like enzyme
VMPIGATLGSEDVMGETEVFSGGTFAWTPPACVAALEGIELIEREGLLSRGERLGARLRERLAALDRYEIVGDVRCIGLFLGVEFVKNRSTKERAVEEARAVHFRCLERGVVDIYDRGFHVVRWQPALTMPEDMLDRSCDILEEAIADVDASR